MPIYEYECEQCKTRVELIQRLSDPPLEICSSCGGKVHKMVSSPAGLLFKGSGWYITDYAKKSGKSGDAPSTPKGEGKSDSSSGSAKGETTPKESPSKPPPPSSNQTP